MLIPPDPSVAARAARVFALTQGGEKKIPFGTNFSFGHPVVSRKAETLENR
jgi:hypothetical protein